jgi:phosphoenolpyruvate---glycerone phosphotransferase subunit DhaL
MTEPMRTVSLDEVEIAVRTMAEVALANERYFSELDSAAGDADFGVSLASGFRVVLDRWEEFDRSSIGAFLMRIGMVITSHVGGCSGPIWGTGFMRSGMAAKGKEGLALNDLVAMGRSSMEGIMARGGAELGDKTLLDALDPALSTLESWDEVARPDLIEAFAAATTAASATIESTRDWVARRGRQSFTGDRSRGTLDPGIVAVATMMQEVTRALVAARSSGKDDPT